MGPCFRVLLGWGVSPTHTLAHSRARCLVRLALRSSAYRAPMKEPIEVPPTRSTGTPASSNAFSTPMCEQPLQGEGDLVTRWEPLWLHPQESPFSQLPHWPGTRCEPRPLGDSHPPPPSGTRHRPCQRWPHPSPGSAPAQHQGDGVAGEHPRQAGEIAVPVRAPREHLLVQLVLGCGERRP